MPRRRSPKKRSRSKSIVRKRSISSKKKSRSTKGKGKKIKSLNAIIKNDPALEPIKHIAAKLENEVGQDIKKASPSSKRAFGAAVAKGLVSITPEQRNSGGVGAARKELEEQLRQTDPEERSRMLRVFDATISAFKQIIIVLLKAGRYSLGILWEIVKSMLYVIIGSMAVYAFIGAIGLYFMPQGSAPGIIKVVFNMAKKGRSMLYG